MNDLMLDLETMGTGPDAAIIAIGAVYMDFENQSIGKSFYCPVSLESAMREGGKADANTILWWLNQSENARVEHTDGRSLEIQKALQKFTVFVNQDSNRDTVRVWGNGAAFDNVILRTAYERSGLPVPWQYRNDRCYRTVRELNRHVLYAQPEVAHHALHDAKAQARHLIEVFKAGWDLPLNTDVKSAEQELAELRMSVARIAQAAHIHDPLISDDGLSERCHTVNQRGWNLICIKIIEYLQAVSQTFETQTNPTTHTQ